MATVATVKFEEDVLFLEKHKEEFRSKYPNKWIAVCGKKIVQIGDDLEQIAKELREKGINPGQAVIEFLATEETTLVLIVC